MTNAQKLKRIRELVIVEKYGDPDMLERQSVRDMILKVIDEPHVKQAVKQELFDEQHPARQLSAKLFNLLRERRGNYKKPDWQKWSREMDRMMREDGRTYKRADMVIRWAHQDDFWCHNILSPTSLRKQFDRLVGLMLADKKFMSRESLLQRQDKVQQGPTLREQMRAKYDKI